MLCRKKKSRLHKKLRRLFVIILLLFAALTALFEMQAVPFTAKCVKKQSRSISAKIISRTIDKVMSDLNFDYDDLAKINFSQSGEVRSIAENPVNVNKLKSRVTCAIQDELDKEKLCKFSLPLGAFTELTLLSTLGPNVEISFLLTGSVNCKIKSKFESSGMNQTIHRIYLTIDTQIISVSPEYREQTVYKTDFEIAQSVIVGSVPSTYADIVH